MSHMISTCTAATGGIAFIFGGTGSAAGELKIIINSRKTVLLGQNYAQYTYDYYYYYILTY